MKQYNVPVIREALARLRAVPHLAHIVGVNIVTRKTRSKSYMGEYIHITNTIVIHPDNHENLAEYIDTLLHELAHHAIAHTYDNVPHHGEAWRIVARYLGANDRDTQIRGVYKAQIPNYLKEAIDGTA